VSEDAGELTSDQYIDAVERNSALLREAARTDLTRPVPTCPGWYVATLVAHIGEVQRFWAHQVRNRAEEPLDLPEAEWDLCPGLREWYRAADAGTPDLKTIPAGVVEWFEGATQELVRAFRQTGPEERIRHWSGDNRAITHMRNQAMEATVHRWDAQNAQGATTPIDTAIALDGIDQHFQVQIPACRTWGTPAQGRGETYHFHRMDGDGEWVIRFDSDAVTVRKEHAKGDIALRGTAEDLFLWLWGRIPADRLEVFGDRSLLERYRELVPS
jgi:uncharacterized protein (TIGR03083 family)